MKPRNLPKARILFIGPIRAGKSSFINSAASINEGYLTTPMDAGEATHSMTLKGLEEQEGEGFHTQDIIHLIEGNVQPEYKFKRRRPIKESDASFNKNPELADKVHCVVFVMACPVIHSDSVSDVSKNKIKTLLEHVRAHGVPVLVVLTHIDEICPEVRTDITTTYHSRAVELCFNKAHELFEVQKMDIFTVKNYSEEVELNDNTSILIMLALRKIMRSAIDRLKGHDDQMYGRRGFYQQFWQYCDII